MPESQELMQAFTLAKSKGDTEAAKRFGGMLLQQQEAAGAPQEKSAEKQPSTMVSQLSHQLGLTARYALEFGAMIATAPADAIAMAARGVGVKDIPMASKQFSSGLTELGFPEPETSREKKVKKGIELTELVAGGSALGAKILAPGVKKLANLYAGKTAKEAELAAASAITSKAEQAAAGHEAAALKAEQLARRQQQQAESAAIQRQKIDKKIAAVPPQGASFGSTGELTRDIMGTSMAEAHKVRAATGDADFKAVQAIAAEKEAKGMFLNPKEAAAPLEKLLEHVQGIPALESKVASMQKMLTGKAVAGETELTGLTGKEAATEPLTMAKAEVARRYLKDIAYEADLEGYPGIARRAAREAATALDKSMGEFVPEHIAYKENWRKLSEPLNSKGTALNKAIFSTEGGLKGDAYAKISAENIPKKLFSSRNNINIAVDALAGGSNAAPEARAAAEKQIQELALRYFAEETRPMSTASKGNFLNEPARRDVLERLPTVQKKLGGELAEKLFAEARSKALATQEAKAAKASAEAGAQARVMKMEANAIREELFRADALLGKPDGASQKAAAGAYRAILKHTRDSGAISESKYKAMLEMISRVATVQEQAAYLRKVAHTALYLVGGYGVARAVGVSPVH